MRSSAKAWTSAGTSVLLPAPGGPISTTRSDEDGAAPRASSGIAPRSLHEPGRERPAPGRTGQPALTMRGGGGYTMASTRRTTGVRVESTTGECGATGGPYAWARASGEDHRGRIEP